MGKEIISKKNQVPTVRKIYTVIELRENITTNNVNHRSPLAFMLSKKLPYFLVDNSKHNEQKKAKTI